LPEKIEFVFATTLSDPSASPRVSFERVQLFHDGNAEVQGGLWRFVFPLDIRKYPGRRLVMPQVECRLFLASIGVVVEPSLNG
jgi:hypothetical protein